MTDNTNKEIKDFTYEEFFNNVVNVLGIGFNRIELSKMATFNSIMCLMSDVIAYNRIINEDDNVYKKYADLLEERKEQGTKLLDDIGYYDKD